LESQLQLCAVNCLILNSICKIWGFQCNDCRLLGYNAVWLLEATFRRNITSIIKVKRISELGMSAVISN
jgi:hypothetical protein